ncbi:MAG: hypothetical protein KatS3mg101_1009 [Patescibacteria group bacterium]|nr:MAG: hypothetical protein KatS3mg101_1009 [Patescibacteria group bacterium]
MKREKQTSLKDTQKKQICYICGEKEEELEYRGWYSKNGKVICYDCHECRLLEKNENKLNRKHNQTKKNLNKR